MARQLTLVVAGLALLLGSVAVVGQATPASQSSDLNRATTIHAVSSACSVKWTGPYFDKSQKQYYYYATNTCSRGVLCSIWNEGIKYSRCVPRNSTRKIHIGRRYLDQPFKREAKFDPSCP